MAKLFTTGVMMIRDLVLGAFLVLVTTEWVARTGVRFWWPELMPPRTEELARVAQRRGVIMALLWWLVNIAGWLLFFGGLQ
jgi:hypothetical protein